MQKKKKTLTECTLLCTMIVTEFALLQKILNEVLLWLRNDFSKGGGLKYPSTLVVCFSCFLHDMRAFGIPKKKNKIK